MKRRNFLYGVGLAPMLLMPKLNFFGSPEADLDLNNSLYFYTYDNPVRGYNYGQKIAKDYLKKWPNADVVQTSAHDYMCEFVRHLRDDSLILFRDKGWYQKDLIVMNDLDAIGKGSATKEEFRNLCYRAHRDGRKIIVNLRKSALDKEMESVLIGFKRFIPKYLV